MFLFFRYFWKIVVNNKDKLAVAFIGINLPNSAFVQSLSKYQEDACEKPITDIFKFTPDEEQKYILFEAYYDYGNIFACNLTDIKLPEMIHARKEMDWAADAWNLLKTK
jgi:hypothetical protein